MVSDHKAFAKEVDARAANLFKAAPDAEFAEIGPGDLQDIEEIDQADAPEITDNEDSEQKTGEVVALDAFRKKKT